MADQAQVLSILLKIASETSGLQQVKAGLVEVKALAEETNASVSGGLPGQTKAIDQASFNVQLEREASLRQAMLVTEKEINVAQIAQVESSALMGVNLGKARQEALVLGRELATGTVTMRTVGSLLGSFGPFITVASLAAYELYKAIGSSAEEAEKLAKETVVQTAELKQQTEKFEQMARAASNLGDVANLGERMNQGIQNANTKLAAFRAQQLAYFASWAGQISQIFASIAASQSDLYKLSPALADAAIPGQLKYGADIKAANEELQKQLKLANDIYDTGKRTEEEWQKFKNLPPTEGITFYRQKIEQAEAAQAKLEKSRHTDAAAFDEYQRQGEIIATNTKHVDELRRAQDKLDKSTKSGAEARKEISASFREDAIHLEAIRGLMAAVDNDPFATVFEKAAAQAKLIPLAIQTIKNDIGLLNDKIKGGALDPLQLETARQKLVQDNLELIKLGQTAKTIGFTGALRADLVSWVNQIGTTAHQVGQAITSSLTTAINGVSNAITGAIFHTQSWGQAFAQVAQQIIGSLINIVIQWAAQQLVMLALQEVFGQSSAGVTAQAAAEAAAAWAPGATAASIATEGEADIAGTAALAIAMGVGQGIVTGIGGGGGYEEGGYTGGIPGRYAGIVHGGEYVFSAPAVQRAGGASALDSMHQAFKRGGYQSGGSVGPIGCGGSVGSRPSAIRVENYIYADWNKLMRAREKSTAHQRNIVQVVKNAGGRVRG